MKFLKNRRLSISSHVAENFDVLYDGVHKTENSFQMDENGSKTVLATHRKLEEAFQLKMIFLKNRRLSISSHVSDNFDVL